MVNKMKWNKKFTYPKSVRSSVDGKRIYEVGSEKLPSVTTILGQTQSDEKRESLAKWIAKKGSGSPANGCCGHRQGF